MKLINVVKHVGKPKLEAVVENDKGERRKIKCTWLTRTRTLMPRTWFGTLKGEHEYQEKLAEARTQNEGKG